MLAPLVILAILSVVGGYVGLGNRFEKFLAPVVAPGEHVAHVESAAGHEQATNVAPSSEEAPAEENKTLEYELMGVSILAAFGGLGLAYVFYVKSPQIPEQIAASMGGLYKTVQNKYYVDEFYGATVIRPIIAFSRSVLWKGIDAGTIDRSVNGAAHGSQGISDGVRTLFSGNIRSYAGWVSAGAAIVIIYMALVAAR